ncbi:MAG: Mitochondrial matrix cochaperone [Icmadophila ericetorum]|nr:Mitochondrial matrix cochaperone [Icmadophila ericetorum]
MFASSISSCRQNTPAVGFVSGTDTPTPEKKLATQGEASAIEQNEAVQPQEQEDPTKKELEAKNKEIIDLKDKYLRSVAEYRNLQERTKRDVQAARDFAITRFAKDLIESIDNLDRALTIVPESALKPSSTASTTPSSGPNNSTSELSTPTVPSQDQINMSNQDLINLYDGLKMTERILMQTLAKHGLERFDPSEKGERFDPNLHEATFQTPMQGKEDGTVMMTQQKGFLLNGRVVRAAKVGVVRNA